VILEVCIGWQKLSRQSIASYFIKPVSVLCCFMFYSWNFNDSAWKERRWLFYKDWLRVQ